MDKVQSPAESPIAADKMDAAFNRFASIRNATIIFWVVFWLFLLFVYYAPINITADSTYSILAKTMVRATIAFWAYADALARNYQRYWRIILMMVIINLPEIVVPGYLILSRGWKGAAKSTLRFAGYLLLAAVIWYGVVGTLEIFDIHEVGEHKIIFDRLHS